MFILTKIALVILAGVYAMRVSNWFFHAQPFQPLWLLALFAFVMSVVLFYRPPAVQGWWQYTVVGLCLLGTVVNALLFFKPDAAHSDPTNMAFSAASIAGWAIVGFYNARLFR
jgi:hypothetical protein